MSQIVNYEFEDGISTITLDDGKVNAMSVTMQQAIHSALDKAEADSGVVVLCGNEKVLSAGFDLQLFQTGGDELLQMLKGGFELSYRIINFPTPVIAACPGHAIAMGFFLLLSCDYRIGSDSNAKLTANEVAIGLTLPYAATEVCKQKLPPAIFDRVTNLAEAFSGQAAVDAGILDLAVSADNVKAAALEKAQQLKSLDLTAYKGTKARTKAHALDALKNAMEKDLQGWQNR